MTKTKSSVKLVPFDAARYLDDEAIAEYMTALLETNVVRALGVKFTAHPAGATEGAV